MRRGFRRARQLLGAWPLSFAMLACTGGRPPGMAPPPDSSRHRLDGGVGSMAMSPRIARPPTPPPTFADPQRLARLRAALPRVERMIADHVAAEGIPALAAGIVVDGELLSSKGWGRTRDDGRAVDENTVFRIGAVTKVVTAMAVLALVADGKIRLDDPAARHLPELGGLLYPSLDGGVITVRHLLTHTAGLPRSRQLPGLGDHPNEEQLLAALDGVTLESAPGETMAYSNLGGGLLGLVVSRASGIPFRDYVDQRVLGPLGIDDMAWDAGDVPLERLAAGRGTDGRPSSTAEHERIGPLEGSGGLYGSITGLAKLASLHLDAWPARSDPERGPIPRRWVRASHQMHAFRGLRLLPGPRGTADGTGLVWQIRQSCSFDHLVWHNGAIDGYRSALFLLPQRGVGVVLLATSDQDLSPLASHVLETLVREAALPERRSQPSDAMSSAIAEVARMYELGNLNEPTYQRLFESSYRERTSLQEIRRVLATSRSRRGPCELDRIVSTAGPHEAHIQLRCERGEVLLHLRLAPQKPNRISSLLDDPSAATEGAPQGRCPPSP